MYLLRSLHTSELGKNREPYGGEISEIGPYLLKSYYHQLQELNWLDCSQNTMATWKTLRFGRTRLRRGLNTAGHIHFIM